MLQWPCAEHSQPPERTPPGTEHRHTARHCTHGRRGHGGGGGVMAGNLSKAASPVYREGGTGSTPQASRTRRGNR